MAPIPLHAPPALSHLVIFNPSLKPPLSTEPNQEENERNPDLEDDLAQAAQILFYTSHAKGDVSRDVMLRQVGLVKGLTSLTDMVAPGDDPGFWSVHSQKARMVVYSPEPDFFIYANIALATSPTDASTGKVEPIPTAQGIPDDMLIDALRRGYDDFRLLHGPLSELATSPNRTSTLDKFWTRFAVQFETTVLAPHPDPTSLRGWLGGYEAPSQHLESATNRAIEVFAEDAELSDVVIGVVGQDGPISRPPSDLALTRYLVGLVQASLPPPAAEPEGREVERTEHTRKSSWAGWVPTIPGIPSRSSTPSRVSTEKTAGKGKEKSSRWPGLSLGGFGESLGSVGQAFSLGGSRAGIATAASTEPNTAGTSHPPAEIPPESGESKAPETTPATVIEHEVQQTSVSLGDLEAAQAEPELELVWDHKQIWLRDGEGYREQSLSWIIRDGILLYLIQPTGDNLPSTHTLSLFSKLAAITSNRESRLSSLLNSAIHSDGISTTPSGPDMDPASAISLTELKNVLESESVSDVFARTSASRFIVAKREAEEETYMLVGKKDASLVDAYHAMRSFERARE